MFFKVNESRSKQCGLTSHFPTGEKLLKKYLVKINIDIINWEKLFEKSANHKECNIPRLVNFKLFFDLTQNLSGRILFLLRVITRFLIFHKSASEQNHRGPDIYINNYYTNVIESVQMKSNSKYRADKKHRKKNTSFPKG